MNIGQKIRELRLAKLMTQSELAGTFITRNMLSCIENGSAQPSLSTIQYIAGRLNVPAGFLLAEEGDEAVYRKMNSFANIKKAYTAGDLRGCRNLCVSGCPEPDDEISLLLADCDAGIAAEEFWSGRLRSSCRFFDEALSYTKKTIHCTAHVRALAAVYFRYMARLSPSLYSDELEEGTRLDFSYVGAFAVYVDALEALDEQHASVAQDKLLQLEEDSFFGEHLHIRILVEQRLFAEAKALLLRMLQSETPLNPIQLHAVLCDLEICCRETEDFKGAYSYSNDKIALLEQLLSEV